MDNPRSTRFVLGIVSVLILTLSALVLPDLHYPLLLFILIGLVVTWREYLRWTSTSFPGRSERR
jgi:hypothetical protein